MSDHAATLLALGVTLALITGIRGERFMQSMRDLYAAQARLRNAKRAMRGARLLLLGVLAVVFAIAWPWMHK